MNLLLLSMLVIVGVVVVAIAILLKMEDYGLGVLTKKTIKPLSRETGFPKKSQSWTFLDRHSDI